MNIGSRAAIGGRPALPQCGSVNVQSDIKHKTMTHRCRDCYTGKSKTLFSLKTGTVMEGSNLKYRPWAVAIYLFTTKIKGVSSMRLHRKLGISQKAAWFMLHRLRMAFEAEAGPVEVNETYFGGKRKNMPNRKRKELEGRGAVGKTPVVGVKDRATRHVTARPVEATDSGTLQGFIADHTVKGSTVYTDDARAYRGMKNCQHKAVQHNVGEYVRDMAHTNGIESQRSMMKRGFQGIYHKMSPKHLDRYAQEFAGRHNARDADTIDQMTGIVAGMAGKRLRYRELIADNGLDNGARSA